MARSLDGLIHHLLDQTALCGEHGALPSDFIRHVKDYYAELPEQARYTNIGLGVNDQLESSPSIDRPFLEYVWKWLTKHSEIRVGDHAGSKNLTLAQVEARNATIEQTEHPDSATLNAVHGETDALPQGPDAVASAKTKARELSTLPQGSQNTLSTGSCARSLQGQNLNESPIATAETAVTAQSRPFQPGIRLYTSENRMWYALTGHAANLSKVKPLDFIVLSIIGACGTQGILQHEIVRISGQDKRSIPARTDRLHDDGYIVKERVTVWVGKPRRMLHTSRCTLTRYAKAKASQPESTVNEATPAPKRKKRRRKAAVAGSGFLNEATNGASLSSAASQRAKEPQIQSEPRIAPQWTPDRPVSNQIFDIVDHSDTQGISMSEIRDNLFGAHAKKVTEDYISRLSDAWQLSQPLHLRHLSIVRDTAMRAKSQIFVYYTYENFKKLVEQGSGFWEAVKTVPESVRRGNNVAAGLDVEPDVDDYNFPNLSGTDFQGCQNNGTLGECVVALNAGPFHLTTDDPLLGQGADGTSVIIYKQRGDPPNSRSKAPRPRKTAVSPAQLVSSTVPTPRLPIGSAPRAAPTTVDEVQSSKAFAFLTSQVDPTRLEASAAQSSERKCVSKPVKTLGRPRKYPKVGVPENLHEMTPVEIKRLRESQEMAEKYERQKIEHEITFRVEAGEDSVLVTHEVLTAADTLRQRDKMEPLPRFSRAQILHKFAGGPMPDPTDKVDRSINVLPSSYSLPKRVTGRARRKGTKYWPSMAAHTLFIPRLIPDPLRQQALDLDRTTPTKVQTTRTRHEEQRRSHVTEKSSFSKEQNGMHYLPSMAAHTSTLLLFPILRPATEQVEDRSKCSHDCVEIDKQYLPSAAAHSGFSLQTLALIKLSSKQNRSHKLPRRYDSEAALPSLSPTETHTPLATPVRGAKLDNATLYLGITHEGAYPGWIQFMSKYYEQQLQTIARPHDGIFFGPTAPRRKRQCEPVGFRPLHIKVVVFKSARLHELDWFTTHEPTREPTGPVNSQTQGIPCPISSTISETPVDAPLAPEKLRDHPSTTRSQSSFVAHGCLRTGSSCVSMYADTHGTKRKRGISSQPGRISPTSQHRPISRGSYNGDEQSGMLSLIVILKVRFLPHMSKSPAEISLAISDSKMEVDNMQHPPDRSKTIEPPDSAASDVQKSDVRLVDNSNGKSAIERGCVPQSVTATAANHSITNGQQTEKWNDIPATSRSGLVHSPSTMAAVSPLRSSAPSTPHPKTPKGKSGAASLPAKKSVAKMSRQGGSVAVLRRNIVMELMKKCDGVYPGYREMAVPFAVEWSKRGQEGAPEQKTVQNAVNQLCAEDKLRRITFTYQNKKGIAATKTMLTIVGIDPADPRVRETQKKMVAYHPRYYIPEVLMLPEAPQRSSSQEARPSTEMYDPGEDLGNESQNPAPAHTADLKRTMQGKKMTRGKDQVVAARLAALTAQEQRWEDCPDLETQNEHGAFMYTAHTQSSPLRSVLVIPPDPLHEPKPPGRRSGVGKPKAQREQLPMRRANVVRNSEPPEAPLPLPPRTSVVASDSDPLTWLPFEYAFSEFNFEDQRPTLVQPSISKEIRSRYARYGKEVKFSKATMTSSRSSKPISERMREITRNAARIERSQAQAKEIIEKAARSDQGQSQTKPDQPSFLYTNFQHTSMSPYAPVRPPSPKHLARLFPYARPVSAENDQVRSGQKRKRSIPAIDVVQHKNRSSESITVSPSLDSPPSGSMLPLKASQTLNLQPLLQRSLLVSFMDPIHYFNTSTGTFSVSFSGIRPPRKVFFGQGTASHPRTYKLRHVAPHTRKRRKIAGVSTPQIQPPRPTERFEDEVDRLLNHELNNEGLQDAMFTDWPIINYNFPHNHTTAETIRADLGVADEDAIKAGTSASYEKAKVGRPKIGLSLFNQGTKNISPAAAEALKRIKPKTILKRRRLTLLTAGSTRNDTQGPEEIDLDNRPKKMLRVRGPRDAIALGKDGEMRLLTAVLVVRTLTGGLEKFIDWVLVAKAFEGTPYDQMFIHGRWTHVLQKHKLILPKMEEDFQETFMRAYEEGSVPSLDFENLAQYNWKFLVEWAMANFGTHLQLQPELPAGRAELDETYTLGEISENDINGYYEIDTFANIVKRTDIINRSTYVYTLDSKARSSSTQEEEQLAIAKTWVRANVITPEETYDSGTARSKLSTLPLKIIEDALKELLLDRALSQENKGRLVPGRNYDVSEHFLTRLKKNLLPAHFKRALAYKKQLDRNFAEKGSAPQSYTADDGDMLATINLLAEKRIILVPIKVPADKWGLTDGGYESRQMDKSRLNFNIELRPLPTYVEGIPLSPFPPAPSEHLYSSNAPIPLWYDIHGQLVPVMWEMALAAVLAILSARPGIGAGEIEKAVRPAMEIWEIERILKWLVSARAVHKVVKGYAVVEWWWLALGSTEEVLGGSSVGASRNKGSEKVRDEGRRGEVMELNDG